MKPGLCPDFPLVPSDWLSSTKIAVMTPAEEGGYFRLLCHGWGDPDCCIPADDISLAALSRLGADWPKSKMKILACFTPDRNRPGFIFNARQRDTRNAQVKRVHEARVRSERANRARWGQKASVKASSRTPQGQAPKGSTRNPQGVPMDSLNLPSSPVALTEQRRETPSAAEASNNRALAPRGAGAQDKTLPPFDESEVYAYATQQGFQTASVEKWLRQNAKRLAGDLAFRKHWHFDFGTFADEEEEVHP